MKSTLLCIGLVSLFALVACEGPIGEKGEPGSPEDIDALADRLAQNPAFLEALAQRLNQGNGSGSGSSNRSSTNGSATPSSSGDPYPRWLVRGSDGVALRAFAVDNSDTIKISHIDRTDIPFDEFEIIKETGAVYKYPLEPRDFVWLTPQCDGTRYISSGGAGLLRNTTEFGFVKLADIESFSADQNREVYRLFEGVCNLGAPARFALYEYTISEDQFDDRFPNPPYEMFREYD